MGDLPAPPSAGVCSSSFSAMLSPQVLCLSFWAQVYSSDSSFGTIRKAITFRKPPDPDSQAEVPDSCHSSAS
jgi:hypothetical protein